ncbi:RNA polymerase sigma factor [Thermoflexibacter ruber]|uniref:RNA polymerase sigma factor n=1 Tax=Thermoflexibacter ruber TaxID=1003 RepID=A0A1I2B221_9BACT|nr:RNA polymerase sigma factor [Thermoflexibacter ruber]SFE50232.1 RNA polymerase sigma-70 factor, ECF subfamily [Thermoflexibacter ruber]
MQVSVNLSTAKMSKVVDITQYQNSNEQIILRCKRGDRKAQYEIYKLYAKAMYNVCLRITGDTLEAEDVLQEAFLIAFEKIETYRNEAAFGAWLKKIVVNAALNQVRKRRFQFADIDSNEDYEDESPHEAIATEEMSYQAEQIRKAIAQLPDGFRIVFSLYLLEGYDHQEIAEILGISVSTSKSQYNRAKKKLQEILKK